MIEFSWFTYSDAQWDKIKVVVRDRLGLDADQIERRVTPVIGEFSITGMQPLRERIQIAVGQYHLYNAVNRRRPSRAELMKLRKDAKKWRTSIDNAVSVPLDVKYGVTVPLLLHSVDGNILKATSEYFGTLLRYLDRLIAQAGSPRHNARKIARNQCWEELLTIWCDLGGEPSDKAAAQFIRAASLPVMGSAIPTPASIVKLLERRQNGTAKTVNPVLRRATR